MQKQFTLPHPQQFPNTGKQQIQLNSSQTWSLSFLAFFNPKSGMSRACAGCCDDEKRKTESAVSDVTAARRRDMASLGVDASWTAETTMEAGRREEEVEAAGEESGSGAAASACEAESEAMEVAGAIADGARANSRCCCGYKMRRKGRLCCMVSLLRCWSDGACGVQASKLLTAPFSLPSYLTCSPANQSRGHFGGFREV